MFTQWLLSGPVQCSVGIKQTQTPSWSFPPASSEDRCYRHTGTLQTDIRTAVQPAPRGRIGCLGKRASLGVWGLLGRVWALSPPLSVSPSQMPLFTLLLCFSKSRFSHLVNSIGAMEMGVRAGGRLSVPGKSLGSCLSSS